MAIGRVTWDVAVDELIPQAARIPEIPAVAPPTQGRSAKARPLKPLDEFPDE